VEEEVESSSSSSTASQTSRHSMWEEDLQATSENPSSEGIVPFDPFDHLGWIISLNDSNLVEDGGN
jgi:hypothetical protein